MQTPPPTTTTTTRDVFRAMPAGGPSATTTSNTIESPERQARNTTSSSRRLNSPDLAFKILQEQRNTAKEKLEEELLRDVLAQLREVAAQLDADEWKYHKYYYHHT